MENLDEDIDEESLWVSQEWDKEIDLEKKRELKLAKKLNNIEQMLKNIYFFTEDQLCNVFNKNTDNDWYFFEQIICDVEQQYTKTPMDIPINEYLYENLMSIEDKTSEVIDQQKYREILNHPEKYIDVNFSHIYSYSDFEKFSDENKNSVDENIRDYIYRGVDEMFILRINEDLVSDKDKKKLPHRIQHLLRFSEYRWINLYTFVQKNWLIKIVPGVFGGSAWRANDAYFGDIFKDMDAKKYEIWLSSLVK